MHNNNPIAEESLLKMSFGVKLGSGTWKEPIPL